MRKILTLLMFLIVTIGYSQVRTKSLVLKPAEEPTRPRIGEMYLSSVDGLIRTYDGTTWLTKFDSLHVEGLVWEMPHASLAFSDSSVALTMDQNAWVRITNASDSIFDTRDASSIAADEDSITIVSPGDYMVVASLSFSGTTNTDIYEFALFKNDALASPKIERTTTSTDIGNVSLPFYLENLVAGDDLSLQIRNTANNFDATLISCSWLIWLLHY